MTGIQAVKCIRSPAVTNLENNSIIKMSQVLGVRRSVSGVRYQALGVRRSVSGLVEKKSAYGPIAICYHC